MTTFPVLGGRRLNSVPWAFVAPHERQAQCNHEQTLARLAQRGGLSACELVAVVEGRDWTPMQCEAAGARLEELLAAWEAR